MKRILVTGGTGTLGNNTVQLLIKNGHDVSVLSSRMAPDASPHFRIIPGDLTDISSMPKTPPHFDTVIHCASNPRNKGLTDVKGTDNLLRWLTSIPDVQLIYISIVGVDQTDYPYYQYKMAAEMLITNSARHWTILRATQFHDLVLRRIIQPMDTGTVIRIPAGLRFQSIDVTDVACKIAEITETSSSGKIITIAGQEILTLHEMAMSYLEKKGRNGPIEIVESSDEFINLFATGINLSSDNAYGRIRWRDYLNNIEL